MKIVKLYGHLGKKFGKIFKLQVSTINEAMRLLCLNLPELETEILSFKGAGYNVYVGNSQINQDLLFSIMPDGTEVRIVPVISGQGGGNGQALMMIAAGALIIGTGGTAAIALHLGTAATATTAATLTIGGGIFTTMATSIGMALIMTGVSKLLYSPPDKPVQSSSFGAIANTSVQGECVPIGYGRRIVGSAVISAGISTYPIPPNI
jgi:predicted phage tail protein